MSARSKGAVREGPRWGETSTNSQSTLPRHFYRNPLQEFDKVSKEVIAVVRPRGSLRMVLDTEDRKLPMAKAFDGLVVQVDVSQFDFPFVHRAPIDCKPMVLSGDLDLL